MRHGWISVWTALLAVCAGPSGCVIEGEAKCAVGAPGRGSPWSLVLLFAAMALSFVVSRARR